MAVATNSTVLWVARPCNLLDTSECFEGICLLHFQGKRTNVMPRDLVDGFQLFRGTCCLHLWDIIIHMTPDRLVD
jgi:hypothetical protein